MTTNATHTAQLHSTNLLGVMLETGVEVLKLLVTVFLQHLLACLGEHTATLTTGGGRTAINSSSLYPFSNNDRI